jgi:hypothetical protein
MKTFVFGLILTVTYLVGHHFGAASVIIPRCDPIILEVSQNALPTYFRYKR